jgi:glyoxylase-like metal-dependent hydrolase (beta-lactamase superfamily II)
MKQKVESGKINENTYLIDVNMLGMAKITSMFAVKGEKTALIDGGTSSEAPGIIKSLKDFGLLPVDYIIISHAHWDHHQAVPALLEEMAGKEVELLAHPKAIPLLEDPSKVGYDFGIASLLPIKDVKPIKEGDFVDLEGVALQVIDTPGHTPDCISLLDSKNGNIFVSDAVADKIDDTTCVPAFMPPSFDPDTYVATLEKLKKYDFESICLGHYGMYYGSDVKEILDEARTIYEQVWEFFDDNVEKLGDVEWIANNAIEKFMPNSETVKRIGMIFALAMVHWLIDGYKMCKKL